MSKQGNRCLIPKLFGKRFKAWCEKRFALECYMHDKHYGTAHRKTLTRSEADEELREGIASKGFPILAWAAWFMVRLFGWIWYKK